MLSCLKQTICLVSKNPVDELSFSRQSQISICKYQTIKVPI